MAERKNTSRATEVRAKRDTKKKRTPARKARAPQKTPRTNFPPVLVRGGLASMAQPKGKKSGKRKAPKRRYDIALSSPGVEIRLPAIPSVHLGWRLASAALFVGLLFLLYHLWTTPLYQIQAVELQGNHYLNGDTVNRLLNVYNRPIFTIDPEQVEEDLWLAFPGLITDVSVQVGLPAQLIVTVVERQPVLAWQQDGKTLWVDVDGVAFDPIGEAESLISVSATGSPPAPIVLPEDPGDLDEAGNPLEAILTPETVMFPEMVAAIMAINAQAPNGIPLVYDPQHGLGWHDERGWDVYFGMDVSDVHQKLIVYDAIVANLKKDAIVPTMISVEHVHAPYYRLEP